MPDIWKNISCNIVYNNKNESNLNAYSRVLLNKLWYIHRMEYRAPLKTMTRYACLNEKKQDTEQEVECEPIWICVCMYVLCMNMYKMDLEGF